MFKIAITGPESSGKTEMAMKLAKHFNAPWVEEYSREYLENTEGEYEQIDLDEIALGQVKKWNEVNQSNIVFYDTEMTVIKVWSLFKYGTVSDRILQLLDQQQFDLYLICQPDIPWEADPLRESPKDRDELYTMYIDEMIHGKRPYFIIHGSREERMQQAIRIINRLKAG